VAHRTPRRQDKPIDLISPALDFSFAQTAASDPVNSGHVHSHAHWYLCVEGIKPVMLQRNYVQKLHLHQTFQLLVALKLVFTKCHKTPRPDSPPTDGCNATVGRQSFLLSETRTGASPASPLLLEAKPKTMSRDRRRASQGLAARRGAEPHEPTQCLPARPCCALLRALEPGVPGGNRGGDGKAEAWGIAPA